MDLEGSVALVTGAAVRLGKALALGLAQAGVDVAVHYNRSIAPAQETVSEIRSLGRRAVAVQADLSDSVAVQGLVSAVHEALGSIDILVNSAAIFERGTLETTTEELWDRHLAINLKAPFLLCQSFARQLQSDRRGHILNIADWRALRPGKAFVAYTVAKAGLVALTKTLALGLAPQIQVNAIAPGAILPPPGKSDDALQRLVPRIPLGHTGSPEDIVEAALYLLRSDFVTGEVLDVTGGEHL
ncbi:MAG: SDR family oxidoreductase [Anaerolineae bacterium]